MNMFNTSGFIVTGIRVLTEDNEKQERVYKKGNMATVKVNKKKLRLFWFFSLQDCCVFKWTKQENLKELFNELLCYILIGIFTCIKIQYSILTLDIFVIGRSYTHIICTMKMFAIEILTIIRNIMTCIIISIELTNGRQIIKFAHLILTINIGCHIQIFNRKDSII